MDALKKAEQEKKEAGKRLREGRGKGADELRLTDKEASEKKTGEKSPPPPESIPSDVGEISGENLTLAPKEKDDDTLELPQMGDNSGVDFAQVTGEHEITDSDEEDSAEDPEDSGSNKTIEESSRDEVSLTPEDVDKEPPDKDREKTISISTDDTEDGQISPEMESTQKEEQISRMDISDKQRLSRSIITAAELAHDIGGGKGKPTPVAAQTVFTAVAGKPGPNQFYRWGIFTLLCMVIAVAIGVFYYLSISPMTPSVTPEQVATGNELDPVVGMDIDRIREAASRPETTGAVTEGSLSGETGTGEEETIATDVQTAGTEETVPADADRAAVQSMETADSEATAEPGTATVADTESEIETGVEAETPAVTAETAGKVEKMLPEKIQVQPAAIQISRSKTVDEQSKLLTSAYADYMAGRYRAAGMKYQAALSEMPENTDALLGMAATEYRMGNLHAAYEHYLRVLKLYPDNKNAKVALIGLQETRDVAEHASTLKLLIQQEPQTPHLYFSLGNIYAGQSRWPEAQQAYFDAYRLDSGNPDYAFNLAVSLDQIGQRRAALDYYRTALQLADSAPAAFDSTGALARINSLTGKINTDGQ